MGNYAGRKVRHLDDYYVAGRNAPTLLIVGSLIASLLSTNAFLGETGEVYGGLIGPFILFPGLTSIGYVYGALYFGRYLRRSRARTVAHFFGERFASDRVRQAAGVTIVIGLGAYLLAVTQGAAVIFSQITDLSYQQALLVAWVSYTAFTLYAGSRGVIITDTLMFAVFSAVAAGALFYLIDLNGGFTQMVDGLSRLDHRPGMMSWHGAIGPGTEWETPWDMFIWATVVWGAWGVVSAVSPWQSSRYLIARNEQVVIRAAVMAMIALLIVNELLYMPAAAINLSNPDIEPHDQAMIWAAMNLLPNWLGAALLTGVMAAAMSSASTFLSLVGFAVGNDILRKSRRDEDELLRFTRRMMLLTGVAVLGIAQFVPVSIFWLTYMVGTVFASSWGPVAFMSVWSKRITADAAFWGIICGFLGNVIPRAADLLGWIDLPMLLHPILIGGFISLVVIILLSKRGEVSEAEKAYREKLHIVPAGEASARWNRRWLPIIMIGFNALVIWFLLMFWVKPYQAATGQLAGDGGLNWSTGEVLVTLWSVPIQWFLAWLVYRTLKKDYPD